MSDNTVRTFIALESSKELGNLLDDTIDKLVKKGFKATWTKTSAAHLTLIFLGDMSMKKIAEMAYKIGSRISGFPTFIYNVSKVGYFEYNSLPRVIWLGVNGGPTLSGLYKEICKAITGAGINLKNEEFIPHISVGRMKFSPKDWKKILETITFEPLSVGASSVGIYSSTLTSDGPIYKKLYKVDFEGGVIING